MTRLRPLAVASGAALCIAALLAACDVPTEPEAGADAPHPSMAVTATGYRVVELATGAPTPNFGTDINDAGVVVGNYITPSRDTRAFQWKNGVLTELGTLGGPWSRVGLINGRGDVAGTSALPNGYQHAFLWRNGVMTDLGSFGAWSVTFDLDERGNVVGLASRGRYSTGFAWRDGVMTELPPLVPGGDVRMYTGTGILNQRGQVVGSSRAQGNETHAAMWTLDGVVQDLGTLGGSSAMATAINDAGVVVGYSYVTPGDYTIYRPFLWRDGVMEDLVELPDRSLPVAINARGQIVGVTSPLGAPTTMWLREPSGAVVELGRGFGRIMINDRGQAVWPILLDPYRGFRVALWEGGNTTFLSGLGGHFSDARALNRRGQIVGGSTPKGSGSSMDQVAVIWEPRGGGS